MFYERTLRTGRRSSYSPYVIRTHKEALEEARRPCGRFKSILPLEESLRAFIAEKTAGLDSLGIPLLVDDATPLNWQRLLKYLHENGITKARFTDRFYRNDYPDVLHFFDLASMEDFYLADGRKVIANGFGGSLNREEAMSKAIGETLERFFLSAYKRDSFHAASYAELARRDHVLDIFQFDFFRSWQKKRFPAFAFDENSVFHWVEGRELQSGNPIFLPAQIVYWSYHHSPRGLPRERIIFTQTTSGSAGHFTKDEATLAALLEAIQRDAFLIYWLNTLTPKVIDTKTVENAAIANLIERLRQHNLEPIFLNTTSDFGIPTATCVVVDTSEPQNPIYSIGSSAGFTLEDTLISSLIEAFAVQHLVSLQDPYALPEKYEPFASAQISRSERLRTWQGSVMAERIQFLLSGEKQSAEEFIGDAARLDTVQKRLGYIVDECEKRGNGYEIYTYEVQHPVLSSLGYHVMRAIVPQLIPLYLVEYAATLNAQRLKNVPEKIGYTAAKELNPWPHPFP